MEISKQRIIYDYAVSHLLVPYRFGGSNSLTGVDCSQLIIEIASAIGMPPPFDMTAQNLYDFYLDHGDVVTRARFGSLSFYGASVKSISHVGFCFSETLMINAAGGGPTTRTLEDAQQQSAFVKVRPIRYRKDLVSILDPYWPDWEA